MKVRHLEAVVGNEEVKKKYVFMRVIYHRLHIVHSDQVLGISWASLFEP